MHVQLCSHKPAQLIQRCVDVFIPRAEADAEEALAVLALRRAGTDDQTGLVEQAAAPLDAG